MGWRGTVALASWSDLLKDLLDLDGLNISEKEDAEEGWEFVRKYECFRASVAELLQAGFQVRVAYNREIPLAPTLEPKT